MPAAQATSDSRAYRSSHGTAGSLVSVPLNRQLLRLYNYILIFARKDHQVDQQLHVVLAVLANFFFAPVAPPLHDVQTVSGFLISQSFPRDVVKFDAMAEPAMQIHEQIKRSD
jgi:hypothetical protein